MTAGTALGAITELLEAAGIDYMLAGSFASSVHGVSRSTADIDIVIDPTSQEIERLIELLAGDRYYVSLSHARVALAHRDQFNVIDIASHWKIDLIVRKDRRFSRSEFSRRQRSVVAGIAVNIATAEDTVVAKLEWAQAGGSERQLRDVAEILRIRGGDLDWTYLDHWAAELGVADLLAEVRAQDP